MKKIPSIGSGKIVVYSRPGCTDCTKVEEILYGAVLTPGKDYIEFDVKMDSRARKKAERLCLQAGKEPRVPVVVFSPDLVFIEPRKERLIDLQLAALGRSSLARETRR